MTRRRYFVTGTDTGVGKTFVGCAMARRAVQRGTKVLAFKPIETGTTNELGDDQRALVEAAGGWQRGPARGIYQFARPAAPYVAAQAESREISVARIREVLEEAELAADLVLVEGAGGLRVPITKDVDMAGLAHLLDLPLIVVARAGLGTINHSLLTIEAAEREGLVVAALILSRQPEDEVSFARSNADEIRRRWPHEVLIFEGPGTELDPLL